MSFELFVDLDEIDRNLRWKPGAKSFIGEDSGFMLWLSDELRKRIDEAIRKQRRGRGLKFGNIYMPLSPNYLDRKKRLNLRLGFWEATGQIKDNLQVFGTVKSRRFRIGWDKRVNYRMPSKGGTLGRSTGTKIWAIVRWLEFGTKKQDGGIRMPARPLIRPILRNMRKETTRLYARYLVDANILTKQEFQQLVIPRLANL